VGQAQVEGNSSIYHITTRFVLGGRAAGLGAVAEGEELDPGDGEVGRVGERLVGERVAGLAAAVEQVGVKEEPERALAGAEGQRIRARHHHELVRARPRPGPEAPVEGEEQRLAATLQPQPTFSLSRVQRIKLCVMCLIKN